LYLNVVAKNFKLEANDKSSVELNLQATKAKLILSQESNLKTLVSTTDLAVDMYQKAIAKVEGTAVNSRLRTDSDSQLTAQKLASENAILNAEGNSKLTAAASKEVAISASGKTTVTLYGDAKVDLKKFTGEATLIKKIK
jgi:hypothetical protein